MRLIRSCWGVGKDWSEGRFFTRVVSADAEDKSTVLL